MIRHDLTDKEIDEMFDELTNARETIAVVKGKLIAQHGLHYDDIARYLSEAMGAIVEFERLYGVTDYRG